MEKSCGVYVRVSRRNFEQANVHWDYACRRLARFVASQEVSSIVDSVGSVPAAEAGIIDARRPDLASLVSTIDGLQPAVGNPCIAVLPVELMFPVLWQLRPVGDVVATPSGLTVRLIWEYDSPAQRIMIYDPAAVHWNARSRDASRVSVECSKEGVRAVRVTTWTDLSTDVLDTRKVWSVQINGAPLTIEEYRQMAERESLLA
jgi:hypothetical protein